MSIDFKARGNAAFSAGSYEEAVSSFSEGINNDPLNHILYSNRSAANAALKNFELALEDAEQTIKLQPTWSKGYGRKAAALHGLGRYSESQDVYHQGLDLEPDSAVLKKGLEDAIAASEKKEFPLNPFASEEAMNRIITDSSTRQFMAQPDFIQKINEIRKNPSTLSKHMQDQRIMQAMFVAMGLNASFSTPSKDSSFGQEKDLFTPQSEKINESSFHSMDKNSPSTPKSTENSSSGPNPQMSSSSKAKQAPTTSPVDELKDKGNVEYKKKNFECALSFYDEALLLDPNSISILLNKAAVYFEQEKWNDCIQICLESVEKGRSLRVDFKLIAKAFGRIGSAYYKQGSLNQAIEYYNKSLSEFRSPEILGKLRDSERELAAIKKAECLSPEISNLERERGNELFKKGDFVEALKHYSEAIARNDMDPRGYSNRAACYTKLAAFPEALRDCDKCIELDPKFIKAYLRRASIFYGLKEYQKCLDACFEAKAQDTEGRHTSEIEQQLSKCYLETQKSSMNESAEQTLQRAMADPEVKNIMTDPVMQSILQQMQSDPRAIQDHMKNPIVANKIRKLMAAGIIRTA